MDFEWTCDDGEDRQVHSDNVEIIEFSFVIYDAKAQRMVLEGQHYCKNSRTPITSFCTELTGISDATLADAGSLADALQALCRALDEEPLRGRPCCAVTHGSADLELILPMHCKALGLEVPEVLKSYADLRLAAQRQVLASGQRGVRASSLREICDSLQVEMVGTEHCGLDDSWMVLLALQQLLKLGTPLQPINFFVETESFLAGERQDSRLCLDGLPFHALSADVSAWMETYLGEAAVRKSLLYIVIGTDGRATGRAVIRFLDGWEAAARALQILSGGKLMVCKASDEHRYNERLILTRPLREDELRLSFLEQLPCSIEDAPALAPFPRAPSDLGRGKKYCFAFQEDRCKNGDRCRYVHEKAPDGVIKFPSKNCHDFQKGFCSRGEQCHYKHQLTNGRS